MIRRGKFNSAKIVVTSTLISALTVMSISSSVFAYDAENTPASTEPATVYSDIASQAETTNTAVENSEDLSDKAADLILNGGEVEVVASTSDSTDATAEAASDSASNGASDAVSNEASDKASDSASESDTSDTMSEPNDIVSDPETPGAEADNASQGSGADLNSKQTVTVNGVVEGEAGNVADLSIKNLKDAAQAVEDDTNFEASEDKLSQTQTDLTNAHKADLEADKNTDIALNKVADMQEVANQATDLVEKANADANTYIEAIGNASTPEEVAQQHENLMNVINTASGDLTDKRTLFDSLSGQYAKAIEDLEKAEEALDKAISDADGDAQEASENTEIAKAKVDALKDAYDAAVENLKTEQEQAQATEDAIDDLSSSWDIQGNALKEIVLNYIIPQKTNGQAENVSFVKKGRGFDRQDNTYYEFSYTLNGEPVTEYYNYDRVNKNYTKAENDRYNHLGNSSDIVIYQKTDEEIKADEHLFDYYKDCTEKWYTLGVLQGKNLRNADGEVVGLNELKSRANNKDFDVFAFGSGENLTVFCREEIEADITANGENSLFKSDGNGGYTYNEERLRLIVQNSKANTLGDRCILSTNNCDELKQFIANADGLVLKYANYANAVNDAKDAVDDAKQQVDDLNDAIDALKGSRGNRVVTAIRALGVNDLATYFGLDVSEEEANSLNQMTLKQAITYLTQLRDDAEEKLKKAELDLKDLKQKVNSVELPTFNTPDNTTNNNTNTTENNNTPSQTPAPAKNPSQTPTSSENPSQTSTPASGSTTTSADNNETKNNTTDNVVNTPASDNTNTNINNDNTNSNDNVANNVNNDNDVNQPAGDTDNQPINTVSAESNMPVVNNAPAVNETVNNANEVNNIPVANDADVNKETVVNEVPVESIVNNDATQTDNVSTDNMVANITPNDLTGPTTNEVIPVNEEISNNAPAATEQTNTSSIVNSKKITIPEEKVPTAAQPEVITDNDNDDTAFDSDDTTEDNVSNDVSNAEVPEGSNAPAQNNISTFSLDPVGSVLGARRNDSDNASDKQTLMPEHITISKNTDITSATTTAGSMGSMNPGDSTSPSASIKVPVDRQTVVITNDDVAKAATIADTLVEKHHVSWWWLLLIILLMIVAYKIYKDHQKDKE